MLEQLAQSESQEARSSRGLEEAKTLVWGFSLDNEVGDELHYLPMKEALSSSLINPFWLALGV